MSNKLPTWFWVIAVIALLWNLMGVFAFFSDLNLTPEKLTEYTEEQKALILSMPSWTKIFYGMATIGGLLGSIALLMRKSWAFPLFVISLIGVLVQQLHSWLATDAIAVLGSGAALIFPLIILVLAIFLVWFSKSSQAKGYLN